MNAQTHALPKFPKRLQLGPLDSTFAQQLRELTANARNGNLDPQGKILNIEATFTGESIGWVASGSEEDVTLAFARAREAQKLWEKTPFTERKKIFRRFHDLVLARRELLCDMVQLETGKNRVSAFDELTDVANNARYYANHVAKLMSPKSRRAALPVLIKSREYRRPLGVVGQITPWNYPLTLGISDAIPALLAGNAVVAKPDSSTPFTAIVAFALLYEAGLPKELVQIVTGSGRVVGTAIAEQCDFLMFTGSTATGKILGETTGRRLVPFSAELGGKNPLIIASDADMDYTVRGAIDACFSNSGQLCVSIERIYVEAPVYEEFLARFGDAVRALSIGKGFDWSVQMGSLTGQSQIDTVTRYVEDAREKGARIIAGATARPDLGPYFYEPTVLADVPEDALLRREEVFGPVVYVEKVDSLHEAIEKANDTSYGLNASVFGSSKTVWEVGPQIESGSVTLNDGYTTAWAAIDNPMGGMKESGVLHRHGEEGLLKYTASQNISEQRFMYFRGPERLSRKVFAGIMATGLKLGKTFRFLP